MEQMPEQHATPWARLLGIAGVEWTPVLAALLGVFITIMSPFLYQIIGAILRRSRAALRRSWELVGVRRWCRSCPRREGQPQTGPADAELAHIRTSLDAWKIGLEQMLLPLGNKTQAIYDLLTNLLSTFQSLDFKATMGAMRSHVETATGAVSGEVKDLVKEFSKMAVPLPKDLTTKFAEVTAQLEDVRGKLTALIKTSFQDLTQILKAHDTPAATTDRSDTSAAPLDLTAPLQKLMDQMENVGAKLATQMEDVKTKLVAAWKLGVQELKQVITGAPAPTQPTPTSTDPATQAQLQAVRDDLSTLAQNVKILQDTLMQTQAEVKLTHHKLSQACDKISADAATSHGTLNSQIKGNHAYMKGIKEALDSVVVRTEAQEPRGWQVKHVEEQGKLVMRTQEIKDILADLLDRVDGLETTAVNTTAKLTRQDQQLTMADQKWDTVCEILREISERLGPRPPARPPQLPSGSQQAPDTINLRVTDYYQPPPPHAPYAGIRPIQLAPLVTQPPPTPAPSAAQRVEALRAALDYVAPP